MTNISALPSSASLTPLVPPSAALTAPPAASSSADQPDASLDHFSVASNAPATNARDSSSGIYTALANVATSTIRGTSVDTAS